MTSPAPQRFNLHKQAGSDWMRRAEICADLIAQMDLGAGRRARLADLGCGDTKLAQVLGARGLPVEYQGFDLLPQAPAVQRLDLETEPVPAGFDIVVMLGVGEYLTQLERRLAEAADRCRWLVFSHVLRSKPPLSPERLAHLGWVQHHSAPELVALLKAAGLTLHKRRYTPDRRTLVLACEGRADPPPRPAASNHTLHA